eukprot:1140057-Pelagomonas_calceolata.AAC.2
MHIEYDGQIIATHEEEALDVSQANCTRNTRAHTHTDEESMGADHSAAHSFCVIPSGLEAERVTSNLYKLPKKAGELMQKGATWLTRKVIGWLSQPRKALPLNGPLPSPAST